jgi:hypothetical protein
MTGVRKDRKKRSFDLTGLSEVHAEEFNLVGLGPSHQPFSKLTRTKRVSSHLQPLLSLCMKPVNRRST